MILSDFLSRQKHNDSNPHETIPISFNLHNTLHEKYYNIWKSEKYLVQMQSQTRSSGIKLPEVHDVSKNLDPSIQPEKQNIRPLKGNEISQQKPRIGKGRAGMRRRKSPINQTTAAETSKKFPEVSKTEKKVIMHPDFTTPVQSVNNPSVEAINRRPKIKDIPFYPDPMYRPPPKLTRISTSEGPGNIHISPENNIDFEENSPFQEGIISETYQRPDKSFFQEPQELEGLVNTGNLVQTFLSKQTDMDKILNIIQRKVPKGTHLPVTIKEIQAGYLVSPYFKGIYLYLARNKLPSTKTVI